MKILSHKNFLLYGILCASVQHCIFCVHYNWHCITICDCISVDSSVAEKILKLLRDARGRQQSALDISRNLEISKAEVNNVLYQLKDEGQVNKSQGSHPYKDTPMWSIAGSNSHSSSQSSQWSGVVKSSGSGAGKKKSGK